MMLLINHKMEMQRTVSLYRKYHYLEYIKKYEEIYDLISRESVYSGKYDEYIEEKFPNEERYSTEVDEVFFETN